MNDLTGKRFGRLVVLERDSDHICPGGYKCVMWKCICDCGNVVSVRGKALSSGETKSCGCLRKKLMSERTTKHGGYGTRLYATWESMRQRCNNPNNTAYGNYGERGITVCPQWDSFSEFRKWAESTGYDECAERGMYTLDRVDVNKGYFPDNCRWANMREQTNNRRETINVEFNGKTHPLSVWAEILGIKYQTLWRRYSKGLPVEEIFSPVK